MFNGHGHSIKAFVQYLFYVICWRITVIIVLTHSGNKNNQMHIVQEFCCFSFFSVRFSIDILLLSLLSIANIPFIYFIQRTFRSIWILLKIKNKYAHSQQQQKADWMSEWDTCREIETRASVILAFICWILYPKQDSTSTKTNVRSD